MANLRLFVKVLLLVVTVGQFAMLWFQLRAYRSTRASSLVILAAGTMLGLIYSLVSLLIAFVPNAFGAPVQIYTAALICEVIQIPLAVWGVAALLRSFTRLHQERAGRVA